MLIISPALATLERQVGGGAVIGFRASSGVTLIFSEVSSYRSSYDVLGYLLRLMSLIWHRRLNAELAKIDLTEMQFVLLTGLGWFMESRPDGVSQKELAESCGCSAALASQVLQKLHRKALIVIRNDARDGRARLVRLSEAGEQRLQAAVKVLETVDKDFRADDPLVAQNLFDALRAAIAVKMADTTQPGRDFGAMPLGDAPARGS
jgi:DNA-binding MarR family transcriptional regulator